jgi:hypothetical protein
MRGFCLIFLLLSFIASIGGAADLCTENDDYPFLIRARKTIEDDMSKVLSLQFSNLSEIYKNIFGGSSAQNITTYFSDRIKKICWNEKVELAATDKAQGIMYVGPQFLNIPQVYRVSTSIHEASHIDVADHENCPSEYSFKIFGLSFRFDTLDKKESSCDGETLGAYSVQYIFMRAITNSCTNCSKEMKLDAEIYGDHQALIRITDPIAAQNLIEKANPNFLDSLNTLQHTLQNRINSGLNFSDWLEQCKATHSCLN